MAGSFVERIQYVFGADVKGMEPDLQRVRAAVKGLGLDFDTSTKGWTKHIEDWSRRMVTVTTDIAVKVAGALYDITAAAIQFDASLVAMSEKTGFTTERLSTLAYACEQNETSIGALEKGLESFSKRLTEVDKPGNKVAETLKALGGEALVAKARSGDLEGVLMDVADAFARSADGQGKAAAAQELFGKGRADLIPLLNLGAAGIREQEEAARAFGREVSTKTAQEADQFSDNLDKLAGLAKGVGNALAVELLPTLVRVTTQFTTGARQGGIFQATLSSIRAISSGIAAFSEKGSVSAGAAAGLGSLVFGGLGGATTPASAGKPVAPGKPQIHLEDPAVAKARETAQKDMEADFKKAFDAVERRWKAEESAVLAMERQLDVAQKATEVERMRFEIAEGTARGFSADAQARLLSLAAQVDAQRAADAAKRESDRATADAKREADQKEAQSTREKATEVERLIESTRTLQEQRELDLSRINQLAAEGLISSDVQARAIDQVGEKYGKLTTKASESLTFMSKLGKQAAGDLQSGFAEFLFDPAEKGFEGLASSFATSIRKMASEALSANLMQSLFGGGGAAGGGLGGMFGNLLGFSGGGGVRGPGTGTSDSIPIRVSDGEYVVRAAAVSHYGSAFMDRLNNFRLPAMPRFSEGGLVAAQAATTAGARGASLGLTINNQVGDDVVHQAMATPAGERVLLNLIQRNAQTIRRVIE